MPHTDILGTLYEGFKDGDRNITEKVGAVAIRTVVSGGASHFGGPFVGAGVGEVVSQYTKDNPELLHKAGAATLTVGATLAVDAASTLIGTAIALTAPVWIPFLVGRWLWRKFAD